MTDKQEAPERVWLWPTAKVGSEILHLIGSPEEGDVEYVRTDLLAEKEFRLREGYASCLAAQESEITERFKEQMNLLRANHATELQQARRDVWREAIEIVNRIFHTSPHGPSRLKIAVALEAAAEKEN